MHSSHSSLTCPGCRLAVAAAEAECRARGQWAGAIGRVMNTLATTDADAVRTQMSISRKDKVAGKNASDAPSDDVTPQFQPPRVSFALAWDPSWQGLFVAHEVEHCAVSVPPRASDRANDHRNGESASGATTAVVMKGGISAFHFPGL